MTVWDWIFVTLVAQDSFCCPDDEEDDELH